jgi:hypothetical protein
MGLTNVTPHTPIFWAFILGNKMFSSCCTIFGDFPGLRKFIETNLPLPVLCSQNVSSGLYIVGEFYHLYLSSKIFLSRCFHFLFIKECRYYFSKCLISLQNRYGAIIWHRNGYLHTRYFFKLFQAIISAFLPFRVSA